MLRKYAAAAVVGLLVVAWVTTGVYAWLGLTQTTDLARSIARATEALRQELEQPRLDLVAQNAFPEGRAVGVAKSTWLEGAPVGSYPQEVLGQAAPPAAAPRGR
jgi:hypothetical protein